jgi:hypothetical protein
LHSHISSRADQHESNDSNKIPVIFGLKIREWTAAPAGSVGFGKLSHSCSISRDITLKLLQLSLLSFGSDLSALQLSWEWTDQIQHIEEWSWFWCCEKLEIQIICFISHVIPLKLPKKLSENFPDIINSKMAILYDNIKWFTPYITGPWKVSFDKLKWRFDCVKVNVMLSLCLTN